MTGKEKFVLFWTYCNVQTSNIFANALATEIFSKNISMKLPWIMVYGLTWKLNEILTDTKYWWQNCVDLTIYTFFA